MDPYTRQTQRWLDQRFKLHDPDGVYLAHQPIYGLGHGHSEAGVAERYVRTYHILCALARLHWDTLLDVGGAEGYKAALCRHVFQRQSIQVDLSGEACRRAQEIYALPATTADLQQLPFADDAFDVVLCSETLEHVPDLAQALQELLRVAKHAVVISVPHESRGKIARNIREHMPHGHLHSLKLGSFNYAEQAYDCKVNEQPILNLLLRALSINPFLLLLEGRIKQRDSKSRYPPAIFTLYNLLIPPLAQRIAKPMLWLLLRLDLRLCQFSRYYGATLCVLTKTTKAWRSTPWPVVTPQHVLEWTVPYYYLRDLDRQSLDAAAGQAQL